MAFSVDTNHQLLASKFLPPCHGPKLHAFKDQDVPIKWKGTLGNPSDRGSECQSYVFKVEIQSQTYALKVFKFFPPCDASSLIGPIRGESVKEEDMAFHTDPFYAECRAYGCIKEAYKTRQPKTPYVADCYGFLALTEIDRNYLIEQGIDLCQGIEPDDPYRVIAERSPVRALVKEYVEGDSSLDQQVAEKIRRGILFMNKIGILIRDVRLDNYVGGVLVDLGSSWTEPHCILDNAAEHLLREWRWTDRVMFDDMLEEEGILPIVPGMPNTRYLERLRPRT
ncbi:kinetochore Sim4 complex subunit FTA2-domain-containing protein [Nemania abortiva]|nr:kinetochore Sim4 complex subunit FTA2-domain-containing protein [Nemania abortiva]